MILAATEPATAEQARRRAQAIHDNPGVPTNLRASAAFTVAQTFLFQTNPNTPAACRWNSTALELVPSNPQYLRFQRERGCP